METHRRCAAQGLESEEALNTLSRLIGDFLHIPMWRLQGKDKTDKESYYISFSFYNGYRLFNIVKHTNGRPTGKSYATVNLDTMSTTSGSQHQFKIPDDIAERIREIASLRMSRTTSVKEKVDIKRFIKSYDEYIRRAKDPNYHEIEGDRDLQVQLFRGLHRYCKHA